MGHHLTDPNELRRHRLQFFATGRIAPGVRRLVAESWLRSRRAGVDPQHLELPFDPDTSPNGRLVRAAADVVDALLTDLSDTATSLVLSDRWARILRRWDFHASLAYSLEDQRFTVGYSLAERHAGTMGIGASLQIGQGFDARGAEHFADVFQPFSTAAAPISSPTDGGIEGAIQIVARAGECDLLLAPCIAAVAANVTRALADITASPERRLLDSHLRASRLSSKPVVSLNDRTLIANQRAVDVLHKAGHEVASLRPPSHSQVATRHDVTLGHDTSADVLFRPVSPGEPELGLVLEFDMHDPGLASPGARNNNGASIAGTSAQWQAVLRVVQAAARGRCTVTIEGEQGIGKLALAQAIHEMSSPHGSFRVLDVGQIDADHADQWLALVSESLEATSGTVVLRHVELLEPPRARQLLAVLDVHAHRPARVVATRTTDASEPNAAARCAEQLRGMVIHVPPLRERPDDIPVLVAAFARRAGRQHQRWPANVMQALARFPWPRNVRQLENAVNSALLGRPTGDLELGDLPDEILVGAIPRPLTRMEAAEATAIMAALREAQGNKAEAADVLGISRSTLYRRLRSFDMNVDDVLT